MSNKDNVSAKEENAYNLCNGGVTEAQIAQWKMKYRKVFEISVIDGEDQVIGYFRRPDQQTMEAVNKLSKNDEVKGGNALFENCWLGGDVVMKEDFIVKMAAMEQLAKVFSSCITSLKNL